MTTALEPRQPLQLAAVHRTLGRLNVHEKQYDLALVHLAQSLSLAEACGAPFEKGLTLIEIAELNLISDRLETARPLLNEARMLCTPMGARPTLERIEALATRFTSTPDRARAQ